MNSRAILVGVARTPRQRWGKAEEIEELAQLVLTAGGKVVERMVQVRAKPDPATMIGKGKAKELRGICQRHNINLVVFEDSLTPTQLRNLEDIIEVRVIDRAAVILDIFALHARTAEAKAQVELAQLEYFKTRLTGLGIEMSQLGGGIGTRGPGETKLEVDRRRIDQRITALRRELIRIEQKRKLQRKRRSNLFQISLAGYTNAGKSTLFNCLTAAQAKVSNHLFATLDASTRICHLGNKIQVLITDTVGFIRNLPIQLVASFRSTLAEVRDADLILQVADISDPQVENRIDIVNETLTAIGAGNNPQILVFNKIDKIFDDSVLHRLAVKYPNAIFISAQEGTGLDKLRLAIRKFMESRMVERCFVLPVDRGDLSAIVYSRGTPVAEQITNGKRVIKVRGFPPDLAIVQKEIKRLL